MPNFLHTAASGTAQPGEEFGHRAPSNPVVVEVWSILPGPPEVVWELITDWEHQGDWMLEARRFEVLSARREGMGVVARAQVTIGGITTTDEVEVVGWDPPRRLEIAHRGWVSGLGQIHLTPLDGERTYLAWRERLEPPLGPLGAFGLLLFKPLMARVFRRDLRVLEGLVRVAARARGAGDAASPANV